MVTTKLSEVMSKGIEWAYGGSNPPGTVSSQQQQPSIQTTWTSGDNLDLKALSLPPPSQQQQQQEEEAQSSSWYSWSPWTGGISYWNYAADTLNQATEPIYSNFDDLMKYFYSDSSSKDLPMQTSSERLDENILAQQQEQQGQNKYNSLGKYSDLTWMLKNPNIGVRGRGGNPSALPAVRSLLVAVDQLKTQQRPPPSDDDYPDPLLATTTNASAADLLLTEESESMASLPPVGNDNLGDMYESWAASTFHGPNKKPVSSSETASLLAEGTLRSLRDFALDEAVELNAALQYWTIRWEMPFLSWLEAGPQVWLSDEGYNHQKVGQKVAQIQAVLARRCSAIGVLQQHLLRAGWQRGVAQWGVLGQGGRWAPVAAFNGVTDERPAPRSSMVGQNNLDVSRSQHRISTTATTPMPRRLPSEVSETSLLPDTTTNTTMERDEEDMAAIPEISNFPRPSPSRAASFSNYYGHGNVFVRNTHGGKIVTDDPAWAKWSVDAVRLIRIHLDRAANGLVKLPYADNWDEEEQDEDERLTGAGQLISPALSDPVPLPESRPLPRWAGVVPTTESATTTTAAPAANANTSPTTVAPAATENPAVEEASPSPPKIFIANLKLLAAEISELITAMEVIMTMQRARRLDRLKPMGWLRRNWYFAAGMTPILAYLTKVLMNNNYGKELAIFLLDKLANFFQEHVTGPLTAIYEQLFRGREAIGDRKALEVASETLQAMILTWLNENHRDMSEAQRKAIAQAMDVTCIDKTKEESMKSVLEGVNVVRMSFIQMQFIYKEVLNALVAMDHIIESNWINMNLAAVTPAIIALYGVQWLSRVLYYVLLKLGKTKEETFASFRQVILDIERLLVMRDNPPFAPPPLDWGGGNEITYQQQSEMVSKRCDTLSADDLGMLMLHIHECRTTLWRDRRRFSGVTIRNVAEDLAELAGERGAVSVQQQILIVSRMCRTYPFLKVLSTGTPFQLSAIHSHSV